MPCRVIPHAVNLYLYTVAWTLHTELLLHKNNYRALQRTYPARCISASIWEQALIYTHVFVDNLYLGMLGQLCAWAESTWLAVGRVDRRGQQKRTICNARGPCQRNWSILKPVFRRFRQIHCAYESLRYLDLEMWRRQTDDRQKPIALPLAHARGVIMHMQLQWIIGKDRL